MPFNVRNFAAGNTVQLAHASLMLVARLYRLKNWMTFPAPELLVVS